MEEVEADDNGEIEEITKLVFVEVDNPRDRCHPLQRDEEVWQAR